MLDSVGSVCLQMNSSSSTPMTIACSGMSTCAAAQASISDGGYWSVEKTSERLVGYAKALVGGDPSKVEMMRDAFVQGYQEAEKLWGGTLPEITQKTYDATMKLFDDWANEGQDNAESLWTA